MERSFEKKGKLVIWKYDDCQWLVAAGSSFLQNRDDLKLRNAGLPRWKTILHIKEMEAENKNNNKLWPHWISKKEEDSCHFAIHLNYQDYKNFAT